METYTTTLFNNWTTPDLFDHLYHLESLVWTTRNNMYIHTIKQDNEIQNKFKSNRKQSI